MTKALVFLAAGVALGLLLAPEKGAEMRKRLLGKFDGAADDVKDSLSDAARNVAKRGKHIAVEAEIL